MVQRRSRRSSRRSRPGRRGSCDAVRTDRTAPTPRGTGARRREREPGRGRARRLSDRTSASRRRRSGSGANRRSWQARRPRRSHRAARLVRGRSGRAGGAAMRVEGEGQVHGRAQLRSTRSRSGRVAGQRTRRCLGGRRRSTGPAGVTRLRRSPGSRWAPRVRADREPPRRGPESTRRPRR